MTAKLPVLLDVRNRAVVVVGGGAVAERRVETLLSAGARVTVVSPQVTDRIRAWSAAGQLFLQQREYRRGDLKGARLAYVATGDAAVNHAVRDEAAAAGIWLNVADQPAMCDFFSPAVVRRGDLTIAVSTAGASPALAARLRERLEHEIGPEYEAAAQQLSELRERCRRQGRPISAAREEIEAVLNRLFAVKGDGKS